MHGAATRTYAELDDRCRAWPPGCASWAWSAATGPYLGPNDPALIETLFATAALGAVFVPLNWRLTATELAYIAGDCAPSVLVHAPAMAGTTAAMAGDGSAAAAHPIEVGRAFEALATAPVPKLLDEAVALDDPAVIIYTSGTTGRPKGATLSHGNITWNCVNVLIDTELAADEVALVCAPLFHVAALDMISLPTLMKGGTVVLMGAFEPDAVLRLIAEHRVTVMFGVPAMFNAMAQVPAFPSADLSSLRRLLCGGAPVPLSTIHTYLDRGIAFLQGYGTTETPGAVPRRRARRRQSRHRRGAVLLHRRAGRGARRPRREAGREGRGRRGRAQRDAGLLGRPDATAEVMDGEWFRSGDVAMVDDEGYVTIVDRMKDMIISGGENIYPAEVEDAIYSHPLVAECAVIGVPDERWGEVGRAIVVLRPGARLDEQSLLDHLDGRLARSSCRGRSCSPAPCLGAARARCSSARQATFGAS